MPAERPLEVALVPPLLHKYVYPGVPPVAVTVAEPLLPPLQDTFVWAVMDDVRTEGSVIVAEAVD